MTNPLTLGWNTLINQTPMNYGFKNVIPYISTMAFGEGLILGEGGLVCYFHEYSIKSPFVMGKPLFPIWDVVFPLSFIFFLVLRISNG